jgi:hypothetical protein
MPIVRYVNRPKRPPRKRAPAAKIAGPAIVTTQYRYKRPPKRKKAVALEAPPIVTKAPAVAPST